jgi:NADPH2:quinone reductase
VLDNVGGAVGEAAFALVAPGGRFSAHGTPSGRFAQVDPEEAHRRGVTLHGISDVQLSEADSRRLTVQALEEGAAGRITPVIGQTYPLAKAVDAHAGIEGRTVFGKTLLVVEH